MSQQTFYARPTRSPNVGFRNRLAHLLIGRFMHAREDKAVFYDEGVSLARERQEQARRIAAIKAEVRSRGSR